MTAMNIVDTLAPAVAVDAPLQLLGLPTEVLRQVASWSTDNATASAFHETCTELHSLRHDPAAAALLLVRCPRCTDHCKALAACSRACGSGTAVVHQLLQLLGAGPDSGGPHTAPTPLLQAMLWQAAECGDATAVRAVLALPQAPDANSRGGHALRLAVTALGGPHLSAMRALLECGADCCAGGMRAIVDAASCRSRLPALQLLLLQHCPAAARRRVAAVVINALTCPGNAAALALLLPLLTAVDALRWSFRSLPWVAGDGHVESLQLMLDHPVSPADTWGRALASAAHNGQAACVALLLARGAHLGNTYCAVGDALLRSVEGQDWKGDPIPEERQRATVRVLLAYGAHVTPAVWATASKAVSAHVMCMLWQARAAAGGA